MDEPSAERSESPRATPRLRWGSWLANWTPEILVVLAFVLVQANGVRHWGYAGQDYDVHTQWRQEAAEHPWHFLTENQSKVLGRTNPPLYHLLAAGAAAVGPLSPERNVGIFNLLTGLSGLLLFMATARMWILNPAVRASLYLLLAFLPVFCIHNLVMASDVLTMPAGGMILLGISQVLANQGRAARSGCALIAGGTALGMLSKFTFSTVPVLVMALAGLLFFRRLLPGKRVVWLIVIAAGLPMLLAGGIWLRFHKTLNSHFKGDPKLGTSFHVSDLLVIKAADRDLTQAIPYSRRRDVRTKQEDHAPYPEMGKDPGPGRAYSLVEAHRYSYPALLIDAVFTDIMDVRQAGRTGVHFGPRSVKNQERMTLAIRSGWLLAFLGLLAAGGTLLGSLRKVWLTRDVRSTFTLTVLALALALAGPVMVAMLYAYDGYLGGYWLPRLILFPLAATLLACFIWLDHLNRTFSRRLAWPLLIVALWQSLLSLSFLVI
jgi:hypothetical protein